MNKKDYIDCIIKMMKKLDIQSLQRIFNYVHNIFVKRMGE